MQAFVSALVEPLFLQDNSNIEVGHILARDCLHIPVDWTQSGLPAGGYAKLSSQVL